MKLKAHHRASHARIQELLLDLAGARNRADLPPLVVQRLASLPGVALARIWIRRPGDLCAECPQRASCPQQIECFQLVAGAGTARDASESWDRIDGPHRRFPPGAGKVGTVGESGEPLHLERDAGRSPWITRPAWAEREGITGFGAHPILLSGNVLGVVGVFSRTPFGTEAMAWLRQIADHLAAAWGRTTAGHSAAGAATAGELLTYSDLRELERGNLELALARCDGKVSGPGGAAELLGIKPTTLASKLKVFGLR